MTTDINEWVRRKAIEKARQRPNDPVYRAIGDLLQHYEDSPGDLEGLGRVIDRVQTALGGEESAEVEDPPLCGAGHTSREGVEFRCCLLQGHSGWHYSGKRTWKKENPDG